MSSEAVDREVVMEDTQAWLTQAVIGLGLCPFANAVHTKHQINYSVCLSRNEADVLALLEREIHALQHTDPKLTQTTLIMAPFCVPEFLETRLCFKAWDVKPMKPWGFVQGSCRIKRQQEGTRVKR